MTNLNNITVKDLAILSGVSVRTLHYYDEIGLLNPERTSSGYRVYNAEHILRLQQILLQKSLGLSLTSIKSALDDPNFDNLEALKTHKQNLLEKVSTTHKMIASIDRAIAELSNPKQEMKMDVEDIFNGFNPEKYAVEIKKTWGDTDSYKTSQKRTQNYDKEDWKRIKLAEQSIWEAAAKAMLSGLSPSSAVAADLVVRHRQHIDLWFYITTADSYVSLADIWESDERFQSNIDKYGKGLTQWFTVAVRGQYGAIV